MIQSTRVFTTPSGEALTFNPVSIFTVVEEDGELKVLLFKDFGDPEGRRAARAWMEKTLAEKVA